MACIILLGFTRTIKLSTAKTIASAFLLSLVSAISIACTFPSSGKITLKQSLHITQAGSPHRESFHFTHYQTLHSDHFTHKIKINSNECPLYLKEENTRHAKGTASIQGENISYTWRFIPPLSQLSFCNRTITTEKSSQFDIKEIGKTSLLSNRTLTTLTDCRLIKDNKLYALENLESGASLEINENLPESKKIQSFLKDKKIHSAQKSRMLLYWFKNLRKKNKEYVIGWSQKKNEGEDENENKEFALSHNFDELWTIEIAK